MVNNAGGSITGTSHGIILRAGLVRSQMQAHFRRLLFGLFCEY